MISPLQRIKSKGKKLTEDDLIEIRHDFMVCYGWIPIEEFKKISMVEIWDLWEHVQRERKIRQGMYYGIMAMSSKKGADVKL